MIPEDTGVFAWKVLSARKVLPAWKALVCGRDFLSGRDCRRYGNSFGGGWILDDYYYY